MQVIKRDGSRQTYDIAKIENAITKAFKRVVGDLDDTVSADIHSVVTNVDTRVVDEISVEEIQDMVEQELMSCGYYDVAKSYILYRAERTRLRENGWDMNGLQRDIYEKKYRFNNESFDEFLERVSGGDSAVKKAIANREFMPAGRILAGRGTNVDGRKVSYTNCYVVSPSMDNLTDIFRVGRDMAITYSRGGKQVCHPLMATLV